jgi:hypothetical protein
LLECDDAGDVVIVDANADVTMQKLWGGISRNLCA